MVERCPDKTEVDGPIPSTLTFVATILLHIVSKYFIIGESPRAFIFMVENTENKDNLNKDKSPVESINLLSQIEAKWWKPVLFFYVKITSWIIFPLLLATLTGRYVSKSIGSQTLFFAFVMSGFGITCFGIYKEIKEYKKDLDKK